jgi:hypothetical protein
LLIPAPFAWPLKRTWAKCLSTQKQADVILTANIHFQSSVSTLFENAFYACFSPSASQARSNGGASAAADISAGVDGVNAVGGR